LGEISVDGIIILKFIIKEYVPRMTIGLIWLRTGSSGGLF
jgi:hypothetical protein